MKIFISLILVLFILPVTVFASELTPPPVPEIGEKYIQKDSETFGEGLLYLLKTALEDLSPSFTEASRTCLSVVCIVLLSSILNCLSVSSNKYVQLASTVMIGVLLLTPSNSLIGLATGTVTELSNYGKLLLPVMTSALAAQGGVSSSAAIYTGSVVFCSFLTVLLSGLIVPLIYVYLCVSVADACLGDDTLKSIKRFTKWLITWSMKISLYIFSGYLGITKIITGSVDAAALKATKLTLSGVIPVVGKMISDSSDAIILSTSVIKNSIGTLGALSILSVFIGPFIKIGVQYLTLKLTGAICGAFGVKKLTSLVDDFSKANALLLGVIGTMALMLLISTVCFMKGIT